MRAPTEDQALLLAHALSLLLRNDMAGAMGEQIRDPETQRAWYEGLQIGEKVLGQIGYVTGDLLDDAQVVEIMSDERLEWHRHRAAHAVQAPLLVLGIFEREMRGRGMPDAPRTLVVVERAGYEAPSEVYRGAASVTAAGLEEVTVASAPPRRWVGGRGVALLPRRALGVEVD